MRLIDIEPLLDECDELISIEWNYKVAPPSWADAEEEFRQRLLDAPVIEAEPVKHGRWVLKERAHYFKCSLCNEPIPYKFGYSESRRYYNYCPNCGAKMNGGDAG